MQPAVKVSVVVPLFNKAPTVADSLRSILNETCPPHEVIVVDDGSDDGGPEIVAGFENAQVKLIRLEKPARSGEAARNAGVLAATGDWIAFLDADDTWFPHHLSNIQEMVQKHPDVGCIFTRHEHVYESGRVTSHRSFQYAAAAYRVLEFADFLRLWTETRECPAWTGASAFEKKTLIRAGLFPSVPRGGDKDTWLRATRLSRSLYCPIVSASYFRDVSGSATASAITNPLPPLVGTAETLMRGATADERRLLRKLINQEIGFYTRFAFRNGAISASVLKHVRLPEGIGHFIVISAVSLMPLKLRSIIYGLVAGKIHALHRPRG